MRAGMRPWLRIAGAIVLLGGGLEAAFGPAPRGDDSLQKIQKELNQVFAKAAKAGPDVAELDRLVGRALDLSIDKKGEDEGFDACSLVLGLAGELKEERQVQLYTEVIDALVADAMDDDRFGPIVLQHVRLDHPVKALKKASADYFTWVERDSKSNAVKAACAYQRLGADVDAVATAADAKKVVAKIEAFQKAHGEIATPFGQTYGQMAAEQIEGLKIIGQPAKPTEGKDLDGVAFKLEDYKGKVVLLDFWGYW